MIHIYLDAEFDAVKINHKFQQAIISLGAVAIGENQKQLDTFYSLVRPMHFRRLNPIVCRMTHLSNQQIANAKDLKQVMTAFLAWIKRYEKNITQVCFYSCGPDDRRTLLQNCRYYEIDGEFFSDMKDLQKEISAHVLYHDQIISPALSLDDLKSVYAIQGTVDHNALSDAIDLKCVHQAYCQGKQQDSTEIANIVKRKIAKQEEAKKRQQKRAAMVLRERFQQIPKHISLLFYPEILEQLRLLKERDPDFPFSFRKKGIMFEQNCYPYEDVQASIRILLEEEFPAFFLCFETEAEKIEKKILLTYRNATMIENIMKRMEI